MVVCSQQQNLCGLVGSTRSKYVLSKFCAPTVLRVFRHRLKQYQNFWIPPASHASRGSPPFTASERARQISFSVTYGGTPTKHLACNSVASPIGHCLKCPPTAAVFDHHDQSVVKERKRSEMSQKELLSVPGVPVLVLSLLGERIYFALSFFISRNTQ